MKYEKTFALIKPGAVHRGLIGEILTRFERRGLNIVGMKFLQVSEEQAMQHYHVHQDKPFFKDLVEYIQSGPVVAVVLCGEHAVTLVRQMAGATDPTKALSGTIRGDYSADIENNIIHTSDAKETADYEIGIYFDADEIIDYERVTNNWSFEHQSSKE